MGASQDRTSPDAPGIVLVIKGVLFDKMSSPKWRLTCTICRGMQATVAELLEARLDATV